MVEQLQPEGMPPSPGDTPSAPVTDVQDAFSTLSSSSIDSPTQDACMDNSLNPAATASESTFTGRNRGRSRDVDDHTTGGTAGDAGETASSEYMCAICLKLLWQPVTTPCGHNFCKLCLDESIHHRAACPLCRVPIPPGRLQNLLLGKLLQQLFPEAAKARQLEVAREEIEYFQKAQQSRKSMGDPVQELPVFRLSRGYPLFPGETITLHAFESNYIALIDTVLQGTREFGIITSASAADNHEEYGTSVKIESYTRTERDNRYYIICKAQFRFVVTEEPILTGHGYEVINHYTHIFDSPAFPVDVDPSIMVADIFCFNENELGFKDSGNYLNSDALMNFLTSDGTRNYDRNILAAENDPADLIGGGEDDQQHTNLYSSEDELIQNLNEINFVSMYKKLLNLSKENSSNPAARYLITYYMTYLAFIGLKRKLMRSGDAGRRLFVQKFGQQPVLRDMPSSADLEAISFFLCRVVVGTTRQKWSWFTSTDTMSRICELAEKLVITSHNVLDLGSSRFPSISDFLMLDTSLATLFCYAAVVLVLLFKIVVLHIADEL